MDRDLEGFREKNRSWGRRFKSSLPDQYLQQLAILATLQIEPLVRLLWVPQSKCRSRRGLASVDNPRMGHPIGAPIRIWFKVILSESSKNAVFPTIDDLTSLRLSPWPRARGSRSIRFSIFGTGFHFSVNNRAIMVSFWRACVSASLRESANGDVADDCLISNGVTTAPQTNKYQFRG